MPHFLKQRLIFAEDPSFPLAATEGAGPCQSLHLRPSVLGVGEGDSWGGDGRCCVDTCKAYAKRSRSSSSFVSITFFGGLFFGLSLSGGVFGFSVGLPGLPGRLTGGMYQGGGKLGGPVGRICMFTRCAAER